MNRLKGDAETTTKACSDCTSEIPLGARRCPMCTAPQIEAG
jgi:RNA polymerase subunit RPABC4/transcription elongation factor Spt4